MQETWVLSLVRELDPTCCNQINLKKKKKKNKPRREAWNRFFPQSLRRNQPSWPHTLIWDFQLQNCEKLFLLKSPTCGTLSWQPSQINTAYLGFPGGSEVKMSACNAGDLGLIPGLGRSPGEGNGNSLQYSCLENPIDGGAWWATVHVAQRVRHNWATSLSLSFPFTWYQVQKFVLLINATNMGTSWNDLWSFLKKEKDTDPGVPIPEISDLTDLGWSLNIRIFWIFPGDSMESMFEKNQLGNTLL